MFAPTPRPTILVLGGTGTVGSRIARRLMALPSSLAHPFMVGSRSSTRSADQRGDNNDNNNDDDDGGLRHYHVEFDWHRRETWVNPFVRAAVGAVYLIAPPTPDADVIMREFVDFARLRGVRRFVLQSASAIEAGGPAMGRVHAYLRDLGRLGEVEWAVLRPTWFQQNFADHLVFRKPIRENSKIYSATGDGKIPWVSADDIAAVAVRTLTDPVPFNTDLLILGPELLSYDDIADILSGVLRRRVIHVNLTPAQLEKRHESFGMPEDYAKMMSALDTAIKFGSENRTNDVVRTITGRPPRKFIDYAQSVRNVWM
ncbi:hypothetical protein VTK56DRAFT_8026 [Thermocarpiscus australiensis]